MGFVKDTAGGLRCNRLVMICVMWLGVFRYLVFYDDVIAAVVRRGTAAPEMKPVLWPTRDAVAKCRDRHSKE